MNLCYRLTYTVLLSFSCTGFCEKVKMSDLKETLIHAIYKYPSLWDLRSKGYHDLILKSNCWKKVAEECGQNCKLYF